MSAPTTLLLAVGTLAVGCVHSAPALNGPQDVARAYGRALAEGRLDDAWVLSTPIDREQFAARYADPQLRKRRADALVGAAEGRPSAVVALEVGPKGWKVVELPPSAAPGATEQQARDLTRHFLAAIARNDFQTVWEDLSASWRARYTPERLRSDFSNEPSAQARLERIRAALAGHWEETLNGPQLRLGEGKAMKLLREGAALKVAALE